MLFYFFPVKKNIKRNYFQKNTYYALSSHTIYMYEYSYIQMSVFFYISNINMQNKELSPPLVCFKLFIFGINFHVNG